MLKTGVTYVGCWGRGRSLVAAYLRRGMLEGGDRRAAIAGLQLHMEPGVVELGTEVLVLVWRWSMACAALYRCGREGGATAADGAAGQGHAGSSGTWRDANEHRGRACSGDDRAVRRPKPARTLLRRECCGVTEMIGKARYQGCRVAVWRSVEGAHRAAWMQWHCRQRRAGASGERMQKISLTEACRCLE